MGSPRRRTIRKRRREREAAGRVRVESFLSMSLAVQATVDEEFAREINRLVLQDSQKYGATAGTYRAGPVVVRWRHNVVYRPPLTGVIPSAMKEMLEKVGLGGADPVEVSGMACLRILKAHPFREGNGRTARGVAKYVLLRAGYEARPSRSIEGFVDSDVEEYYESLAASSVENPGPWMEYYRKAIRHAFRRRGSEESQGILSPFVRVKRAMGLGQGS